MEISQQSIELIVAWEVGDGDRYLARASYEERFARPHWPGTEATGLTIGIGYDLRHTKRWFLGDWKSRLEAHPASAGAYRRLAGYLGKTGSREAVRRTSDIVIPWEDAVAVFRIRRLPLFIEEAKRSFPGVSTMGPDVWGALTSVLLHRHVGTDGHSRPKKESIYAAIKDAVAARDAAAVAARIRDLKTFTDELLPKTALYLERRHEDEARLAEGSHGSRSAA